VRVPVIHWTEFERPIYNEIHNCETPSALDAAPGAILWQFAAGSSVNSGPAVAEGTVSWGSGSNRWLGGNGNNRLYAFSLDGKYKQRSAALGLQRRRDQMFKRAFRKKVAWRRQLPAFCAMKEDSHRG
jgi:hypothetical protein